MTNQLRTIHTRQQAVEGKYYYDSTGIYIGLSTGRLRQLSPLDIQLMSIGNKAQELLDLIDQYPGIEITPSYNLPKTAFGEVHIAENTPVIQALVSYNFIPSNFRSFTSGSGSTGAEDSMMYVSSGTTIYSYGTIQSFRSINYKAGQGCLLRFTAVFENNVANSWQGIGAFTIGDELSFGYNGTTFGIWHKYHGKAEVQTIQVTNPASGAETLTLTLNSIAYNIPLTSGTVEHNANEIEVWLNANQSAWVADQIDDTIIISAQSDSPKSGTYSFSSAGAATGTVTRNTLGVAKTSDFIPQTQWNQNTMSDLDPSKGNVYQIRFQYLGFGDIYFYVEDPESGEFELVHIIQYPNTKTVPSLGNPSLRLGLYAVSIGSTTDLIVRCPSIAGFLEGKFARTRNPRSVKNTRSVPSTFTNILTLRNRRTYNYQINQVEIEPINLTISNESSKNVVIELRASSADIAATDFTNVGTNLISDIDTSSHTDASGRLLASFTLSGGSSLDKNLENFNIQIPPSLKLKILARVTGGASSQVTATLTYYEDI